MALNLFVQNIFLAFFSTEQKYTSESVMESTILSQQLESLENVIEVTPIWRSGPRCGMAAGSEACGQQKWTETNNPGRGNTPGYQWVGEGQAGGLVKGDAVNATTTGGLVA
ncbi:hypothetical protein [Aeromonas veronii]|uniref:hypothetical protein n=1 Tax=Aeromonas veronii TaxID=654 RepID=UPI0038D2EC0B